MATKQQQTEQAQEKLLYAGFEVLKLKGVKGLTAAQIAEAAGVSKGGFFHHFPKIEDFYLYMLDQMIQMMDSQIFGKKPKTLLEFLELSTETCLDMMDQTPEIMTAIYYFIDFSRFNPTYTEKLQNLVKAGLGKWVNDLSAYVPAGMSEEKRLHLVYILDIFYSGLGTHYLVLKDRALYQQIAGTFIQMVINYTEEGQS